MPLRDPFVFEIDRKQIEEENYASVEVDIKARDEAEEGNAKKYNDWFRIKDLYNSGDERRDNYRL